jgi:hypothetical protein
LRIVLLTVLLIFALSDLINAQSTCNEQDVFEIDRIKQEIETSLINAKDVNVKLESGENLLAFYVEGKLVKISVDKDNSFMIAELFFKDGFLRYISAEEQVDGKLQSSYMYFKDDKLICYEDSRQKDVNDSKKYRKAEKKWLKNAERYLEAIQ